MSCLSVYWNSKSTIKFSELSDQEFQKAFKDSIATPGHTPKGFDYIVKPISAKCKLKVNTNRKVTPGIPKVDIDITTDSVQIDLRKEQYHDSIFATCSFADFFKGEKFRKFKPPRQIRPTNKEGARLWWKYAQTSVLSQIKDRNRRWTWAYFKGKLILNK